MTAGAPRTSPRPGSKEARDKHGHRHPDWPRVCDRSRYLPSPGPVLNASLRAWLGFLDQACSLEVTIHLVAAAPEPRYPRHSLDASKRARGLLVSGGLYPVPASAPVNSAVAARLARQYVRSGGGCRRSLGLPRAPAEHSCVKAGARSLDHSSMSLPDRVTGPAGPAPRPQRSRDLRAAGAG
jgi:hypothetical protein